MITVSHLTKQYRIYQKTPGFLGSLTSLFNRQYETLTAVDDISFTIDKGELIGFIGPNGAGKTTTLKTLSGLLHPSQGKISVLGYTPFERKNQFLKQIALVMGQKNQLWWDLPPIESFLLNKEIYQIPTRQFNQVFQELTELLDIKDILKVQVRNLSLGQRMKCELAAALLHAPKILFLDEPTIGLDVLMQKKLREFIKNYNQQYNATIILTSHYMADVEALCKRVIIINHGRLLFDGLLSHLIQKFAPFKTLSLVFKQKINPNELKKFGKLESFTFPNAELQIPLHTTNHTTAQILQQYDIADLKIEDPDIEDIIRDVFNNKNEP